MDKDMPKVGDKFYWKYSPANKVIESTCYEIVIDSRGNIKYYIDSSTEKVRTLVPETDIILKTENKNTTQIILDEHKKNHEWISVNDMLPPKNDNPNLSIRVLVASDRNDILDGTYDYRQDKWLYLDQFNITHWMFLPDGPNKI